MSETTLRVAFTVSLFRYKLNLTNAVLIESKATGSTGEAAMLPFVSDRAQVVNRTVSRSRGRDVWLTLAGWLWLIYLVGVTMGAISWLLSSPQ